MKSHTAITETLVGTTVGSSAVLQVQYGETIEAVDELIDPPAVDDSLAPGFIDLQVNGFAGVDYNEPSSTSAAIAASLRKMFETGVTRCFPTVITGSFERMSQSLRNLRLAQEEFLRHGLPEGNALHAFHVEGPYISPEDGPRGAHPLEHVRAPSLDEFSRLQEAADGLIRLFTISPEWPEATHLIERLVGMGVVVSIGHTKATDAQIHAAANAGATMSTHLGNGAHSILPKTDNYIWAQLANERLTPGFIVDGIHLPAPFFRAAVRAKGTQNSVLVTDAAMPAMCEPGPYRLGQVDVELHSDGSVRLAGGTRLAGSGLRMDHAVSNCVRFGGVTLREALTMATVNAARAGRITGRQRPFSRGERADFIRFRWDEAGVRLTVLETVVAGQTVYKM